MIMRRSLLVLAMPTLIVFVAFWLLPVARLLEVGASGPTGARLYLAVLTEPSYARSLFATVMLSTSVTVSALVIAAIAGFFLERHDFRGKSMLVALLGFPLAFPGVVVGFLIILATGRQGLLATLSGWLVGERVVLAYGIGGLFIGYLYFSIPRAILTIMASTAKLDQGLEEAARTLGASTWQVTRDVVLPGLAPAFVATAAICFATCMGAFGTAFTLATSLNVLPVMIYNEFTNYANFPVAAALSIVLGVVTWLILAGARQLSGIGAAASA